MESRLRNLKLLANVRIEITDDRGNVVCQHCSPISDWVLSMSASRAEFWHQACRDIRFRRGRSYTIAIQTDYSDTTVEKVMAIPILQGGGNEW